MASSYLQSEWDYRPDQVCTRDHEHAEHEEDEDESATEPASALSQTTSTSSSVTVTAPASRPQLAVPKKIRTKKYKRTFKEGSDSKKNRAWISPHSKTPLKDFFWFYRKGFTYNTRNAVTDEYYRLCNHRGWHSRNPTPESINARKDFKAALICQFNFGFGSDLQDLEAWKRLCEGIGFEEKPNTVQECQALIGSVHVNVIDLIDKMKSRKTKANFPIRRFATAQELAEYSRETHKLFPPYNGGGLLSFMMRHLKDPQRDASRPRIAISHPQSLAHTEISAHDQTEDDPDVEELDDELSGLRVASS